MAWHIDGFRSAEIAATLHIDPAAGMPPRAATLIYVPIHP